MTLHTTAGCTVPLGIDFARGPRLSQTCDIVLGYNSHTASWLSDGYELVGAVLHAEFTQNAYLSAPVRLLQQFFSPLLK